VSLGRTASVMFSVFSLLSVVVGICVYSVTRTFQFQGWGRGSSWTIHPYEDLGLRLVAFGIFAFVATLLVSLIGRRTTSVVAKIHRHLRLP
jgi:putative Mn2+ efflux pump MntP